MIRLNKSVNSTATAELPRQPAAHQNQIYELLAPFSMVEKKIYKNRINTQSCRMNDQETTQILGSKMRLEQ